MKFVAFLPLSALHKDNIKYPISVPLKSWFRCYKLQKTDWGFQKWQDSSYFRLIFQSSQRQSHPPYPVYVSFSGINPPNKAIRQDNWARRYEKMYQVFPLSNTESYAYCQKVNPLKRTPLYYIQNEERPLS